MSLVLAFALPLLLARGELAVTPVHAFGVLLLTIGSLFVSSRCDRPFRRWPGRGDSIVDEGAGARNKRVVPDVTAVEQMFVHRDTSATQHDEIIGRPLGGVPGVFGAAP